MNICNMYITSNCLNCSTFLLLVLGIYKSYLETTNPQTKMYIYNHILCS